MEQARQGSNPDHRGWSSPCFRLHHGPGSGRPGSNGSPRSGVRCPLSYVRDARLDSNRRLCRRRASALPLSYERMEPPAGVEPAPRPYKGRVLAVDTTEARVETVGSRTRHRPRCKRGALPVELHPREKKSVMRTGGVEPPQREATAVTARRSSPLLSVRMKLGWPTGFEPVPRGSQPRVLPLHHGHHETGTTGLEPAPSRLTSERSARLSYAPDEVRGWDSNPRSRAHEAREDSRSSTAQVWPAGVEPAISGARSRRGGHTPLQPDVEQRAPPAGLEPAASGLRARRHRRFDHGGKRAPAAGLEPASRD